MRRGDGLALRGKTWYLDARINGQRYVVRLGKNISRSVAGELASIERAGVLRQAAGIGIKKKDIGFNEAAACFLRWAESNKRPRTVRTYRQCVAQLLHTVGGARLSTIGTFAIERHKRARKAAPVRANRELETLRRIFYWCIAQEPPLYEGANPLRKSKDRPRAVSFFEESEGRVRYLDAEEETRLLVAAPEPVRSMIILAVNTGLRLASEGLTLQWDAVDLARRRLTILNAYAKNKRARSIPLNGIALETLSRLKAKATGPYVFEKKNGDPYKSFRTSFEKACAAAKLDGVTPHVLRHTFCSRLIDTGADVRTTQDLGGWKTLKMVQRYAHPNERGKMDAVTRLESFHNRIPTTPEVALVKAR
jgi:integrase